MKPVLIAQAAEDDLRAARRHYNLISPALGDGFLWHVEDALDQLTIHPELYQIVFDDIRRVPLHRFPYNIFYLLRSTNVEVIALLHAHRDASAVAQRASLQR